MTKTLEDTFMKSWSMGDMQSTDWQGEKFPDPGKIFDWIDQYFIAKEDVRDMKIQDAGINTIGASHGIRTVHKPRLYSYDEVLEIIGEDENTYPLSENFPNAGRNLLRAELREKLSALESEKEG